MLPCPLSTDARSASLQSQQHLRETDEVQLHYLLSTPSHQTFRRVAETIVTNDIASPTRLDPSYPVLLVFPSECFSVVHLFPHILADPDLANRFNILALDPRGHGLTREVPPRDSASRHYDLDSKAADCIEAVQMLLSRTPSRRAEEWKIHVVACGMSGLVATRAAAVLPTIVSLTIVSPIQEVEVSVAPRGRQMPKKRDCILTSPMFPHPGPIHRRLIRSMRRPSYRFMVQGTQQRHRRGANARRNRRRIQLPLGR